MEFMARGTRIGSGALEERPIRTTRGEAVEGAEAMLKSGDFRTITVLKKEGEGFAIEKYLG